MSEKRKRRQRFRTWCEKDLSDDRKIHYTCNIDGEVYKFTSDDKLEVNNGALPTLRWLNEAAMIDDIKLIDNEWHVVLSE